MTHLGRRDRQIGRDAAVCRRRIDARGDRSRQRHRDPAVRRLQPDRLARIHFGQLGTDRAVCRLCIDISAAAGQLDVAVRGPDAMRAVHFTDLDRAIGVVEVEIRRSRNGDVVLNAHAHV